MSADLPEPLLTVCMINTLFSCTGSFPFDVNFMLCSIRVTLSVHLYRFYEYIL